MNDHGQAYDYPASVALQIKDDTVEDYVRAAAFLNAGGSTSFACSRVRDFGGEAGGHIVALLTRLRMPVITTLHTVLAEPTTAQRSVLDRIVEAFRRSS